MRSKPDLVGVTEIAERAHVKPDTVHKWRARHSAFPKPVAELAAGSFWDWKDVAKWLKTRAEFSVTTLSDT